MASWQSPDRALVAEFEAALPLTQGVERRKMFGCPCAFLNGNMFAGVHEHRLIVRIPSEAAVRPFAPMGRAMREYAAIEHALDCEPGEIRALIARALDHVRALPAKHPKSAAGKAAATRSAGTRSAGTRSAGTRSAVKKATAKKAVANTAARSKAAGSKRR